MSINLRIVPNTTCFMNGSNMQSRTIVIPYLEARLQLPKNIYCKVDGEVANLEAHVRKLEHEFGLSRDVISDFNLFNPFVYHLCPGTKRGIRRSTYVLFWKVPDEIPPEQAGGVSKDLELQAYAMLIEELGLKSQLQAIISQRGYAIDTTTYEGTDYKDLIGFIALNEAGFDLSEIEFAGDHNEELASLMQLVISSYHPTIH